MDRLTLAFEEWTSGDIKMLGNSHEVTKFRCDRRSNCDDLDKAAPGQTPRLLHKLIISLCRILPSDILPEFTSYAKAKPGCLSTSRCWSLADNKPR